MQKSAVSTSQCGPQASPCPRYIKPNSRWHCRRLDVHHGLVKFLRVANTLVTEAIVGITANVIRFPCVHVGTCAPYQVNPRLSCNIFKPSVSIFSALASSNASLRAMARSATGTTHDQRDDSSIRRRPPDESSRRSISGTPQTNEANTSLSSNGPSSGSRPYQCCASRYSRVSISRSSFVIGTTDSGGVIALRLFSGVWL